MTGAVAVLVVCAAGLVLVSLRPGEGRRRLDAVLARGGCVPRRAGPAGPGGGGRWRGLGALLSGRPWAGWRAAYDARRDGPARRRAVIALCRGLAAELRAGQAPEEALRIAAGAGPLAGCVGGAGSLRAAGERDPDLRGLGYLAVCWEVAADTGAGLADVVDSLAEGLTEQEDRRAETAARTAGPRATAVVLGVLPLVGLLMSAGLGGAPLVFLFTTPLGWACLVCGAALDLAGAWWTLRMVRGALADP